MSDPVTGFRDRTPSDIPPNSKTDGGSPYPDEPLSSNPTLPSWVRWIVGSNLVMVHVVVILVGIDAVPFTLGDVALVAYIVTGLGIPVGLSHQAVRGAIAALIGTKT